LESLLVLFSARMALFLRETDGLYLHINDLTSSRYKYHFLMNKCPFNELLLLIVVKTGEGTYLTGLFSLV